jgi:DNA repair protein RadD
MIELRPYQKTAVGEAWDALKKNDDPVLFIMSVGGGKSYCIASILKSFESNNKRALCLVNSAELVRNNSKAFKDLGGKPAIFCASLGEKDINQKVIFATPQSVMSAIKKNHVLSEISFNIIVVDEAHMIPFHKPRSIFMRIIRHYKLIYKDMRLLGLTGTPFRGSGTEIVGNKCLFKSQVANIDINYLIENQFLVEPCFRSNKIDSIDFSNVKVLPTGNFDQKELQLTLDKNHRLTGQILIEVQEIIKNRNGAFIFCSTKKHCLEAMRALPPNEASMIIGETPDKERNDILYMARSGQIKYLVSVNCLMTGVDCPRFDSVVWLRPTSSLVLYMQGIGRGLRLYPSKSDCLILDFAGNLDLHRDIDEPIINKALLNEPNEAIKEIPCPECLALNSVLARRCCGILDNKKRCDFFFEFKECDNCGIKNDVTARDCRGCDKQLIDPNEKLTVSVFDGDTVKMKVLNMSYQESDTSVEIKYTSMISGDVKPIDIFERVVLKKFKYRTPLFIYVAMKNFKLTVISKDFY